MPRATALGRHLHRFQSSACSRYTTLLLRFLPLLPAVHGFVLSGVASHEPAAAFAAQSFGKPLIVPCSPLAGGLRAGSFAERRGLNLPALTVPRSFAGRGDDGSRQLKVRRKKCVLHDRAADARGCGLACSLGHERVHDLCSGAA